MGEEVKTLGSAEVCETMATELSWSTHRVARDPVCAGLHARRKRTVKGIEEQRGPWSPDMLQTPWVVSGAGIDLHDRSAPAYPVEYDPPSRCKIQPRSPAGQGAVRYFPTGFHPHTAMPSRRTRALSSLSSRPPTPLPRLPMLIPRGISPSASRPDF